MTDVRHARVRELFLAALDRPTVERPAFLAQAAPDTAVRREVEALLAYHVETPDSTRRDVVDEYHRHASRTARFMPGDLVANRYRMVAPLGSGGMGVVWQADDLVVRCPVAIKFVHTQQGRAHAALLNEVRLARQVTHPNVCRMFDVAEHEGELFLSMELVRGEHLAARIRRSGRLPVETVVDLGCQLCDGLAAAHALGVVHRDLKPANILIDESGRPRITDFGVATIQATPWLGRAGTPGYMAPEQAAGATIDATCDLWALGAVLFEMIAGAPAVDVDVDSNGSAQASEGARPNATRVEWTRLPADTPPALRDLLSRCLVEDPSRRIADARVVHHLLREALGPSGRAIAERSVLVLPFDHLGNAEDGYFSDGLTEDVIAALSRIDAVRVISRATTMRLKRTTADLPTLARELDVRYILQGSVRKNGFEIRITVQLADARADHTLWSDQYRGTLDEIFDIQEQVCRAIGAMMRLQLSGDDDRRLATRTTTSGLVYDLYLRTRRDISSFDRARIERARDELERARALGEQDPLVWAGLGTAYWQLVNTGFSTDEGLLDQADVCARQAVAREPGGLHGTALLANLASRRGSILDWVRYGEQAVAAAPRDPDALLWLAMGWTWAGHPERARPLLTRLEAVDPMYDYLFFARAFLEQTEGQFQQALLHIRRARSLEPGMVAWTLTEIQLLLQLGRDSEAVRMSASALPPVGEHPLVDMTRALVSAVVGQSRRARALLTPALTERLWPDLQYAYFVSQAYAALEEVDEALRWLTQSTSRGFVHYPYLSTLDPLLKPIRRDARFDRLMHDVRDRWDWIGSVKRPWK